MTLVMQLCHTIFEHLCCKVVANLHVHFEDVVVILHILCTRNNSLMCVVCNIFLQNTESKQNMNGSAFCVLLSSLWIYNLLTVDCVMLLSYKMMLEALSFKGQ